MSTEHWRTYPFDARYEVSTLGNVRNVSTGAVRKPSNGGKGYLTVVFSTPDGFVGKYIHRMVAETYISHIPDDMTVSHLNGDRTDNRLDNLTIESLADNHARKKGHGTENVGTRNGGCKLTEDQVVWVRKLGMVGMSSNEIAKAFPVSSAQVRRIVNGINWDKAQDLRNGNV